MNAVNGVVNIITKSSQATHGGSATLVGGRQQRGSETIQYGAGISATAELQVGAAAQFQSLAELSPMAGRAWIVPALEQSVRSC